jgi:glycosyltransferase involved in cell wall biosynthesis
MRLLIVTQKVNPQDQILGFFVAWIREFAKHVETVTVVCLEKSNATDFKLPANVKVLSLGKEENKSRIQYLRRFYRYIWGARNEYDVVLVHMNPVYVILGAPVWKLFGKKVALWYTHKNVDLKLRMATALVNRIFTASKESFRLKTKKLLVTGHGIDTALFAPSQSSLTRHQSHCACITVARIAPAKNQFAMVQAVKILSDRGMEATLVIIGDAITPTDIQYKEKIQAYVTENSLSSRIHFKGSMPHDQIVKAYREADLFINLSDTGSLDKAVLEAMASEVSILTSNEAYQAILQSENFTTSEPIDVAEKIQALSKMPPNDHYRIWVVENHSLSNLIARLYDELTRL